MSTPLDMPRHKSFLTFVILLLIGACTSAPSVVQIPTLAALPSATPTPTDTAPPTATATITLTPTETATPDFVASQVRQGQLTNESGQMTLAALWTLMVASPTFTLTPTASLTPTMTITNTLTPVPTQTDLPIESIEPKLLYIRATANLRTCASQSCPQVDQLHEGDRVMATGTIQGEVVTRGNSLWYRVDQQGRQVFIYSELVADAPPTPIPQPQPNYGIPILCQDGTISYAATTQGACSGHGGIYQPPVYSGGGSICADGTRSRSTGRGTCSYHGGVAH